MSQSHSFVRSAAAFAAGASMLLAPFTGAAEEAAPTRGPLPERAGALSLRAEAGIAFPLTEPQSLLFGVGGSGTLKASWPIGAWLEAGGGATFLALSTEASVGDSGRALALGPTLRLRRPHASSEINELKSVSPWVDADLLYVRTGELNRAGFALGAGAAFPIGVQRAFWIGPFVRYFQIVQRPERDGYDNRHAKLLSLGVSLEVGPAIALPPCVDPDGDGLCRGADRCPDVAGPKENRGCPKYKRLVVGTDRLELSEKLYFAWDQAVIDEVSFPVLDEVVQALQDNRSFRVQVEGHASSEGTYDHNQNLSEKRAEAVLDYLAAHGVARERLLAKGFSSSVPAATNLTEAGREANRRVEFVVHFNILDDGSK